LGNNIVIYGPQDFCEISGNHSPRLFRRSCWRLSNIASSKTAVPAIARRLAERTAEIAAAVSVLPGPFIHLAIETGL
jgi:hypothetical protein